MRTAVINMFHMFKKLEEKMIMVIRNMEDVKKLKWNFQRRTSKTKNTEDEINSRLNTTEDKIMKFKNYISNYSK